MISKTTKINILLTLTYLVTSSAQTCSKNCIGCQSQNQCIGCFHTHFIKPGRCGTDISHYEQTHCMLYYKGSHKCGWCAPGFDLSEESDECLQSTHYIDYCRYSIQVSGKSFCEICEDSIPNQDSTECIPISRRVKKKDHLEHCLWTKVSGRESYQCVRCKEGYSINMEKNRCEKAGVRGCWKHEGDEGDQECFLCDPWLGFASLEVGECGRVTDLFLQKEQELAQESIKIIL
jgi:hypothetical protein